MEPEEVELEQPAVDGNGNNHHTHQPQQDQELVLLATTSLRDFEDKGTLLQNIGYLRGIRVDNNDGPRNLRHRVAKLVGTESPLVQEMNNYLTETITTSTERETNYVHHGWSTTAISTICPWTSSRIAANNQPNENGAWVTRRTLVQRFSVQLSLQDLAPVSEFKAEIEAALRMATVFQKFEAVYRALHKWGDVVALEVEMGTSLTFTDSETNMSQLPNIAEWNDTNYLTTIRTARTTRQGPDSVHFEKLVWPARSIPTLQWRQIRIKKVAPTIRLLSTELQERLSQLYAKRLSYVPAIMIGPSDSSCRTQDDSSSNLRQVSGVIIYTSDWIRSMRFIYADKMGSNKHEGSEQYGAEHTFRLENGEYITEMLIWRSDWIDGLQFVTNLGRCSPHFGGSGHTPIVARSKGGVLVGVVSMVKKHSSGYVFRKIQGIWRHDVLSEVPKQDDVFSNYYGSKNKGRSFNDRVVVGNSDMVISKIDVWSGSIIDSLQLTYIDGANRGGNETQTEHHGGSGGNHDQFILNPGEHIISVSGRYDNDQITQLCFVTDKGRTSKVFGQGKSNGESHSISVSSPEDNQGKRMRLRYICGKSDATLNGIMFIWTPM